MEWSMYFQENSKVFNHNLAFELSPVVSWHNKNHLQHKFTSDFDVFEFVDDSVT